MYLLSRQRFFQRKYSVVSVGPWCTMCIRPSFRNEVYFGKMDELQGDPRAVWMVGDFSERMLITPPEEY